MHTSKIINFVTILKKYYFFLKHAKKMIYHAKYFEPEVAGAGTGCPLNIVFFP